MDDIDERNRVMRKTVSIILWLIFLLLVVSMISGVLNGTAESVVMFFKIFYASLSAAIVAVNFE